MARSRYLPCFLLMLLIALPALHAQNPSESLDAMVRKGMADWEIPGMVTTVVQDGEVVFSKAYGVSNLRSKAAVDRQTLFNMGSTTKAVVCMALGLLVDRGELQWEDKVYRHLPEFQVSDPYIREEARIKDLLTHNLGISQADLIWFADSTSTTEALARFALAEKAYPIRGGYQYNNLMYAVAGEVIRAVSGKHWTRFVRDEIFAPLEMDRTVAMAREVKGAGNYATPYYKDLNGSIHPVPLNQSDQIGAAGMIYTCLEDVEHYLQMLTSSGAYKGKQLLSRQTFDYLFQPHAFVPEQDFYPTRQLTAPQWHTYGLGWFQHDYRGQKLDFHTGSITGLVAIAGVMHHARTAVYVMANLDHAELRHAILYKAMDLWAFQDDSRDWNSEIQNLYGWVRIQAQEQERKTLEARVADTRTSLPLSAYAGRYSHPMLGTLEVREEGQGLLLDFNGYARFQAAHWHYDTFRTTPENRYRMKQFAQFLMDPQGQVRSVEFLGETLERKPE